MATSEYPVLFHSLICYIIILNALEKVHKLPGFQKLLISKFKLMLTFVRMWQKCGGIQELSETYHLEWLTLWLCSWRWFCFMGCARINSNEWIHLNKTWVKLCEACWHFIFSLLTHAVIVHIYSSVLLSLKLTVKNYWQLICWLFARAIH